MYAKHRLDDYNVASSTRYKAAEQSISESTTPISLTTGETVNSGSLEDVIVTCRSLGTLEKQLADFARPEARAPQ